MTPEAVDRAARRLLAARREGRVLPGLPADCRPASVEDGYAIQARLVALSGLATEGWFLGCTNPEIQRLLGIDGPYFGRLLAGAVRPSPAEVAVPAGIPPVLEAEFAFRLAADLPPRDRPYAEAEVVGAVATVHAAIEVVIGHFEDWPRQPIATLIADNGTDGALVIGSGVECPPRAALGAVSVSLAVNGERVREGSGERVLPLSALAWLANERARRGDGLRAGQICNTGSTTAMYFAAPGDHAVAEFSGLGRAELRLRL